MNKLTWNADRFYLDGEPFQIRSAAMHYFRIVPQYWQDRLQKLKDCGFNTVETYTCWNLHERREGVFDFTGILDLESYVAQAAALGLKVILRPGPYICAEWDAGGLPSWLLTYPHLPLRCYDEVFLGKVRRYYTELFRRLRPYLATNGGPILMVQVENEYGSYGNDKRYLQAIADLYRELGVDVPLFTSDGPTKWMLNGGTLPDALSVANFGSRPREAFTELKAFKPEQPLMCGEFWCGWFDHWYEEHHVRTADSTVEDVRTMLDMGASFNVYMFHGGTNFGFWNGANDPGDYQPTVTSYDYCAPLAEDGSFTDTYYALQRMFCERDGLPVPAPAPDPVRTAYGEIRLTESLPLCAALPHMGVPVSAPNPLTFEQMGLDFGYAWYSTTLCGPFEELPLNFGGLHDRAHIFVNGELRGIQERDRRRDTVMLQLNKGESVRLDILVENMGRVNYGPRMFDEKGILGGVRLGQQYHFGWMMQPLPMEGLSALPFENSVPAFDGTPLFLRGTLHVEGEPADTFLRMPGLEKGFVVVNGFNIGRYYNSAGPTRTLYLPAPLLHAGDNEVIVFESDAVAASAPLLVSEAKPDLGDPKPSEY